MTALVHALFTTSATLEELAAERGITLDDLARELLTEDNLAALRRTRRIHQIYRETRMMQMRAHALRQLDAISRGERPGPLADAAPRDLELVRRTCQGILRTTESVAARKATDAAFGFDPDDPAAAPAPGADTPHPSTNRPASPGARSAATFKKRRKRHR